MPSYASSLNGTRYRFDDLKALLACASPLRSGDQQIGRHTSELQSLMRNSYAVFCLKKKISTLYLCSNCITCLSSSRTWTSRTYQRHTISSNKNHTAQSHN